ncbi:Ribosomal protein L9, partial [mine drainage metagenome]
LFPRGLAEDVSDGTIRQVAAEQKKTDERNQRAEREARQVAARIESAPVVLTLRVGENGRPFGSVTAIDIAQALEARGIRVDKRRILLKQPIRQVGTHEVVVHPHPKVSARLTVEIRGA